MTVLAARPSGEKSSPARTAVASQLQQQQHRRRPATPPPEPVAPATSAAPLPRAGLAPQTHAAARWGLRRLPEGEGLPSPQAGASHPSLRTARISAGGDQACRPARAGPGTADRRACGYSPRAPAALVRPLPDHLTAHDHHDAIGAPDGRQPVRDDHEVRFTIKRSIACCTRRSDSVSSAEVASWKPRSARPSRARARSRGAAAARPRG